MDLVAMFVQASREFGARVHAVQESQWGEPTPDTEWNVADLVGHLVEEHRWAPPLLHGMDLDSAGKIVEGTRSLPVHGGVGANLAQEWDEAMAGSIDAVTEPGAVDRQVALSRGATPASTYIAEMIFDAVVHAWDLGKAINYPAELPEELVAAVYSQVAEMGDLSGSGLFNAPVAVADDAPLIDKLVAATGRDPAQ